MFSKLDSVMASKASSDDAKLNELGYKQEFKRGFNFFSSFALSFSVVSILTGLTSLYGYGLTYGGPVVIVWGWLIVSAFTLTVGLAMAEICSAYPTSGGLYYWSYKLAGKRWAPLASWITGWFNLLGQAATTAGIDMALANFLNVVILLTTGTATGGGFLLNSSQLLGLYGGILIVHGLLNSFSDQILAFLSSISVWWHIVGTMAVIVVIPWVAPITDSASYVFTTFTPNADVTGITSSAYTFLVGLLMSQWTLTGYDASAHVSEETANADYAGPVAIITTIVVSALVGWGYLLALTFSIQDPSALFSQDAAAGGLQPVAQIMWDVFYGRFGSGTGGVVMFMIPCLACFFCGLCSVTSNSRMLFAFSRDGAVPGSSLWRKVNPRSKIPVAAVWGMVALAFCLGLPILGNSTTFAAVTSISTIGLYISYGVPIFLRLTVGRKDFQRGPFHLGAFSELVGWTAVLWVLLITAIFVMPTVYPVTQMNLNYAGVAVGILLFLTVGWWLVPGVGARHWFTGPRNTIMDITVVDGKEGAPVKSVV